VVKLKAANETKAAGGGAGYHDCGFHHGLPVAASGRPASSASQMPHFGVSFGQRVFPVLGHFGPLLLSPLILQA